MNKNTFTKKFLGQRWYGMQDGMDGEPIITNKLSDLFVDICDTKEEFIDEVSQWCYDSRTKSFCADIDGPAFTSASTKKEVEKRLSKGWN